MKHRLAVRPSSLLQYGTVRQVLIDLSQYEPAAEHPLVPQIQPALFGSFVKTSSGSSVLSSKIASAAGFSNTLSASVSAPVTESNQTPPPAPQNSKSATNSDKKKKKNNWKVLLLFFHLF